MASYLPFEQLSKAVAVVITIARQSTVNLEIFVVKIFS